MENLSVNPENYKILVVDDIATNVLLLKTILGKAGYRIVTATGGREAAREGRKRISGSDSAGYHDAGHERL